ncbi:hypothetical protein [Leisingera sp. S232]
MAASLGLYMLTFAAVRRRAGSGVVPVSTIVGIPGLCSLPDRPARSNGRS